MTTERNQGKKQSHLKQFWMTWRGWVLLALFLSAVVVVLVVLGLTDIIETGLDEYTPPTAQTERAKTLWDWMDLLLIPLVLAVGAAFFAWVTNKREREAEDRRAQAEQVAQERRAQTDREIEQDRSRESALQAYLDRMTALIRDGLREAGPEDVGRSIARARTLTALWQLDGRRRSLLIRFLYESGLIGKEAIIDLHGGLLWGINLGGSHLKGINLRETELRSAHLHGTNLEGASLERTDLHGANLGMAVLRGANLKGASLFGAKLIGANLEGANLCSASMRLADLRHANLERANLSQSYFSGADLRGANLEGANLEGANLWGDRLQDGDMGGAKVDPEQLAQAASLEGATMPDGTVHE